MSETPGTVSTGTVESNERPTRLFDEHSDRLYRLARRLAPNADEALDLVQEVFLRVARSPHAVPHGRREEEAWLVRVLVNIRRDQWRKESLRRRKAAHVGSPDTECPSPERSYVRRIIVWRALDALPPRRRAILVLHEIEALSASTIASLLGITIITVSGCARSWRGRSVDEPPGRSLSDGTHNESEQRGAMNELTNTLDGLGIGSRVTFS
jgi:RNA polymerase sigma-70 factor (ECF subfamily)